MIVYKVTNCINDKVYICVSNYSIEQAKSVKISRARSKPKKMKLKDAYKSKSPFDRAILRHGEYNFKFETLHMNVSKKKAYKLKIQYIKDYNAMNPEYGYNCTTGGIESFNHADHVIDRLIVAHTGKTMPESFVNIMKARVGELHPAFGFKHSKEVRARMSQAQKDSDYVQSEETKKRKSETMKKRWQEPEIIAKMAKRERGEVTEETRRKLSKANSGKNNAMYGRTGALNPNYGKKMSDEQKQKLIEGGKKYKAKKREELVEKYKNRTEKKCIKCKKVKAVSEFDKSYSGIDPIIGKCKPCEKNRAREKYYRLRSPNKTRNRFGKLIKDVIKENK